MSASLVLICTLVGMAFAIIMGFKFNHNVGLWCYIFAWLIGCFGLGLKPNVLVKMWPTTFTFLIMAVTSFYGYLQENGALVLLAKKILYAFRNSTFLLPWVLFFLALFLSMSGAGATAGSAVLAPIGFTICLEAGISPLLAICGIMIASAVGSLAPWSTGASLPRSYFDEIPEVAEISSDLSWPLWLNSCIVAVIIFAVSYIIFKGFKVGKVTVEKPEAFNDNQRKSLLIALAVAVLVIVPALAKIIFKLKWKWLGAMDIQYLALTGSLLCFLLKLGDQKKIIKDRIPWSIMFMVIGVTQLMGVAAEGGVLELVASVMANGMSNAMICGVLALIAGFMSFFSGGMTVVSPMLLPLMPSLMAATGLHPVVMAGCIVFGASVTGMSPFSTGGAICLGFYPDEATRSTVFTKQFLLTCLNWIICAVCAYLGVFGLIHMGIF